MKILIIENTVGDYKNIREELIRNKLSFFEEVYPLLEDISIGNDSGYFNDFEYLKNEYRISSKDETKKVELFEKIYNHYINVDCYIIDKELVLRTLDSMGIEFAKFLINEKGVDTNKIFITTPQSKESLGISIDLNHFQLKTEGFQEPLIKKIHNSKK